MHTAKPDRVRIRSVVVLLVLLVPMAVRTTPPSLPPYHSFNVSGTLVRTGGGPVENYTIGVAVRSQLGAWELVGEGARPLSITRDDGRFYVIARTYQAHDSLAVAVVLPGEELRIAEVIEVDGADAVPVIGSYTRLGGSDGCCEDTTVDAMPLVEGFVYYYPDRTITVP